MKPLHLLLPAVGLAALAWSLMNGSAGHAQLESAMLPGATSAVEAIHFRTIQAAIDTLPPTGGVVRCRQPLASRDSLPAWRLLSSVMARLLQGSSACTTRGVFPSDLPVVAEVVDGVVDPSLGFDVDVEQLCARDFDARGAFRSFDVDTSEALDQKPTHNGSR